MALKDELLALLAADPDVRAAVREAVGLAGDTISVRRMTDAADVLVPRPQPGWITRRPHEKTTR